MIFLPKTLSHLIPLTADDNGRFAMSGVRLIELDGGPEVGPCFRVEVTDGRRAVIVRAPCEPHELDAHAASMLPVLDPAGVQGIVPADHFLRAIKAVPKPTYQYEPRLIVSLGQDEVILATHETVIRTPYLQGRYPDFEAVLPKKPAPVCFKVNPHLLIELLKAAAACCEDAQAPWVEVLYWSDGAPVGIITRGADGLTFDGLLMPLV